MSKLFYKKVTVALTLTAFASGTSTFIYVEGNC